MKKLKKILLIDDDEITCYLTKNLLDELEVAEEVHYVHDGSEALQYLQQLPEEEYPEVIFLDINMPKMDGLQLIDALVEHNEVEIKKLNIIMLTTSMSMRDVQKAASFGNKLKGYITKPLDAAMVKEVLKTLKKE